MIANILKQRARNTSLVISIHSFVDLITNSSSELFICSTEKSIEAVKEIIEELYKDYLLKSEREKEILWGDIFLEPTCATGTHLTSHFSPYLLKTLKAYENGKFNYYQKEPQSQAEIALMEDSNNITKLQEHIEKIVDEAEEGREVSWKESRYLYDVWDKRKNELEFSLFREFLHINNVSPEITQYIALEDSSHNLNIKIPPKLKKYKTQIINFLKEFNNCQSWGMEVKKGDIILQGASDNSIPYDLFDQIEETLNASRLHLG